MRICMVNAPVLARTVVAMGHEVLSLDLGLGPFDLASHLAEQGFDPELVLHVERLGPRSLLMGLGSIACPKLYWALDVHLNAWWHRYYGLAFDGVMCAHKPWVSRLKAAGVPNVINLPWFGSARPWRPWSERGREMAFVGRLSKYRPVRGRMVSHLVETFGLEHVEGLSSQEMLDLYDDTCLAPNESIYAEVNFRLFEAASCGCLVLNQVVEGGPEHVFAPGQEIVEYDDVLELEAAVRFAQADPARAEAMAHRAWERVNREHLAEHRIVTILQWATDVAGTASQNDLADAHVWQAICRLNEGGMLESDLAPATLGLLPHMQDASVFAAVVRCRLYSKEFEALRGMFQTALVKAQFAENFEVNQTCSCVALEMDDWESARAFWLRHITSCSRQREGIPESPVLLLRAWAKESERFGVSLRPGFVYDKKRCIPDSALECLLAASELEPENIEIAQGLNRLLAQQPSALELRMLFLSFLSLHDPDNWRLGMDLGLVNLRAMRLRQGLEELVAARKIAQDQGRVEAFDRVLGNRGSARLVELTRELAQGS